MDKSEKVYSYGKGAPCVRCNAINGNFASRRPHALYGVPLQRQHGEQHVTISRDNTTTLRCSIGTTFYDIYFIFFVTFPAIIDREGGFKFHGFRFCRLFFSPVRKRKKPPHEDDTTICCCCGGGYRKRTRILYSSTNKIVSLFFSTLVTFLFIRKSVEKKKFDFNPP